MDDAHFVLSSFVGALNSFKFVLPMDRIVAIVWDFYLHCVAVDNQSLYILEVYHSEFARLLWQHFIPQIIDLESMVSVSVPPWSPLVVHTQQTTQHTVHNAYIVHNTCIAYNTKQHTQHTAHTTLTVHSTQHTAHTTLTVHSTQHMYSIQHKTDIP